VSWQGHPAASATRPRTAVTHPGISLGRLSAASAGPDAQPSWPGPPRSTPTPSCQHEAPPHCRSDCSDTLGRIASSSWEHMFAPMEHTALLSVATSPLTAKPSGRKSGSHPTHQGLASARAATPACADFRTPCATTVNGCDPQIGREQVARGSSPSPGSLELLGEVIITLISNFWLQRSAASQERTIPEAQNHNLPVHLTGRATLSTVTKTSGGLANVTQHSARSCFIRMAISTTCYGPIADWQFITLDGKPYLDCAYYFGGRDLRLLYTGHESNLTMCRRPSSFPLPISP
jgi:hypothetical protein